MTQEKAFFKGPGENKGRFFPGSGAARPEQALQASAVRFAPALRARREAPSPCRSNRSLRPATNREPAGRPAAALLRGRRFGRVDRRRLGGGGQPARHFEADVLTDRSSRVDRRRFGGGGQPARHFEADVSASISQMPETTAAMERRNPQLTCSWRKSMELPVASRAER